MALIIDGYNLMHAAGILARGAGPGSLERSRLALLNFVVEALDEPSVAATTVVFDARNAPPGLPHRLAHRGLTVLFAASYESADELIEELICADSAPRRLTVVSGDHRLQRAARHRRAKAIDSDRWYADMLQLRTARRAAPPTGLSKPAAPAAGDVEFWLRQFADGSEAGVVLPDDGDIFPPGYGEDIDE
jgi:uncharacterized protein